MQNAVWPRIASALILAPLAVGFAWAGGIAFACVLALTGVLIAREWARLVGQDKSTVGYWLAIGAAPTATGLYVLFGSYVAIGGLVAVALAAFAVRARTGTPSTWMVFGAVYAGFPMLCLEVLRGADDIGLAAILWLFGLVWAADTAAYAIGRTVGGARLAPQWSPSKTWSGAIAGFTAAGLVGLATALWVGNTSAVALTALSAVLGVAVVLGDLGESGLKRYFGAKDTGALIPGHGGVMDRVDGLVAAAVVAATIGLIRGGPENPAEGILIW